MFITIPVLLDRYFDEVEAEEAGVVPGKEKTPEEIEFELEKLLAPYDYATTLNISCGRGPDSTKRTVPNYGARFDFWDVDDGFFAVFESRLAGVEDECRIYSGTESPGHSVIAAADLPLDVAYGALVTPDGQYHELWTWKPREEAAEWRADHTRALEVPGGGLQGPRLRSRGALPVRTNLTPPDEP